MNKILNINLGGYALTIDDDAYDYLNAYFNSLRKRFAESEGRDEILRDIETRMGEIITGNLGGRSIVMLPDVESAVQVMGRPEDFGGDPIDTTTSSSSNSSSTNSGNSTTSDGNTGGGGFSKSFKTGKKMMRDLENSVVGGVCAGLSAYFGLTPIWMRVIFVVLGVVSAGFWIPAYVLMWIILPSAKTAADRLAMRGERIDVDNIAKEIETRFEQFSKTVNELGDEGKRARMQGAAGNAAGQMANGCGYVVGKVFIGIMILLSVSMILGLGSAWAAGVAALFTAGPYINQYSPISSSITYMGIFNGFFLIGLPIIGLILWLVRTVSSTRIPKWIGGGITGLWVLNLFSLMAIVAMASKQFRSVETLKRNIDLSHMKGDTLRVEGLLTTTSGTPFFEGGDGIRIDLDEGHVKIQDLVAVRVKPNRQTDHFMVEQVVTARGNSSTNASENASQIQYDLQASGNRLLVPTVLSLQSGAKWHAQRVRVNIAVPEGKYIVFDENIYANSAAEMEDYSSRNHRFYISRKPERVFKMTSEGLLCVSCEQNTEMSEEDNYEKFILEGDFKTEIRKGDAFKLRIEGTEKGNIQIVRTGEKLTLTTNGKPAANARVFIEATTFTSLHADNTGQVTIRGFEEGLADISASGSSRIKAYLDVSQELDVRLSGKCSLELTGKGGKLTASLNDGAVLEASTWRAEEGTVTASDGSKARINAREKPRVEADASSTVKVEGGNWD